MSGMQGLAKAFETAQRLASTPGQVIKPFQFMDWLTFLPPERTNALDLIMHQQTQRQQLPKLIRMPADTGMLHFDRMGNEAPLTYSNVGDFVPEIVEGVGGHITWQHPETGWSTFADGIDTKTGELCHDGNCVPRAIVGVGSGINRYDDVVRDLRQAELFRSADGFSGQALSSYMRRELGGQIFQRLAIEGHPTIQGAGNIAEMYQWLGQNFPTNIMMIDTPSGGHALSHFQGLQQHFLPNNVFDETNTTAIYDMYTPVYSDKDRTRTLTPLNLR